MANEFRIFEPLVVGSLSADPGTGYNGEIYYNTTSNSFRIYQNGAWTGITAGSGTVTSVSVVSANGFAGTVANSTTTPAITMETTITGLLQGNGTAISAYTGGNLTDSTSGADGIAITGGSGAVIGSGTSIAQSQSSSSTPGYLSSADWTTFNNKQPAGNYITALTGDVSASGPGSATATLATVNSNTGSFGSSTSIPSFTVNGKGLITAASGNAVIAPAGTLSGTTLNSTVVDSSLENLGIQNAALDMGSNQIHNVTDPTSAQDAATKNYVDNAINGLTWKGPVQAYSTSNVPLSGSPSTNTLTIDGYSVQNGDYVILSNQTTASQNNVYVASGIGGTFYTLSLAPSSELTTAIGDAYLIENGTVWANSAVQANAISPNNTYIQFAGPNFYSFTSPLSLTGTTVSIGYDNSTIGDNGSNQLYVKNNGITNTQLAQMSADTLKGNNTGGTANAADLTVSQVTAMIGVTTATASSLVERDSSGNTYQNQMNAVASSGPQERLSDDGTNFLETQYVDSVTLTHNTSSPTNVDASLTFATASYGALQVKYYLNDGTNLRTGTLLVISNSSVQSIVDTATDSADMGIQFSLSAAGSSVSVQYTDSNATTDATMRMEITRFRA
jgi:hypothetical protein